MRNRRQQNPRPSHRFASQSNQNPPTHSSGTALQPNEGPPQQSGTYQNPPKPAKFPRTSVPPPQSARIIERHVAGQSIREIAREEKRDRATVTKIVRSDQVQEFVHQMRERYYGLGDDAIDALQNALRDQKDGRLAFQMLASIGAIPSPEEARIAAAQQTRAMIDHEMGVLKVVKRVLEVCHARGKVYNMPPDVDEYVKKAGGMFDPDTGEVQPVNKKTES